MKKLLLVISLVIPLLSSNVKIDTIKAENDYVEEKCDGGEYSSVRILNNYNAFVSNGFVYDTDENYTYVVTSSRIVNNISNFSVMYSDGTYKNAIMIGYDKYNEVAVLRTNKVSNYNGVCFANTHYLYKGQINYIYGYLNAEESFTKVANLSLVGKLYSNKDYKMIYKSVIQINGSDVMYGAGVFDELDRLIGMITGYELRLMESCYIVDVNKIIKIADSIVKTGNYNINYIKYSIVDYSSLSNRLRESYGVNKNISKGVVIVTFKPFNYIFGGLNQGMVITEINGVEISSIYELDKQISRYDKKSTVCLTVVKKNGKIAYYYVKV